MVAVTRIARPRLIDASGNVSTLAGDGVRATVDGPVSFARFARPRALAIDSNDNIYISDDFAHRIRRMIRAVMWSHCWCREREAGQEGIAVSSDAKTLYVAGGPAGSDDPEKKRERPQNTNDHVALARTCHE